MAERESQANALAVCSRTAHPVGYDLTGSLITPWGGKTWGLSSCMRSLGLYEAIFSPSRTKIRCVPLEMKLRQ
ncbi:Hypothetical predicted protein [Cloeon dipterum]|uniref:Uncharacterized protein n=1 Tax=Cloeon dipterum TaxID=197152 RepID=A0A8S1C2Z2_9INSE|nr:Hypothetical predicted protein [Cloeon dipterum]